MGDSATGYSALVFTHLWDSFYGWSEHSLKAAGALAAKAVQTAISIDPNDELARTILATVYWFAGNLEGAMRERELALEHNPNYNVAHAILGILLCRLEPDQFERSSEHF
jgi:Tfp pilus assembly protein PilF